jgi:RNA polymerase sigma factor (sigma-70 family)
MPDTRDIDLVRDYVGRHSEPAFTELVRRHVNLVYSVAFRHVGDSQDAQDVTQAVFILLARKATSLRHRLTLTGWLYETTRFTSRQLLRTRNRRQSREHEAYMQTALDDPESETTWEQLAPLLEEAMAGLSEKERALIALRFFENKSITETAALLGIQEWAARKRVERAMERLRDLFAQRGMAIPAAALATSIATNSIQAAPAGLAHMAAHAALAKGAGASGSTLTLIKGALKIMAYKKLQSWRRE